MSEMIERVARAICAADGRDPDGDATLYDNTAALVAVPNWWCYEKQAGAAIAAIETALNETEQARAASGETGLPGA